MPDPYLSEIRIMAFSFAPRGWMLCNGQLLPINQYSALFALLGTTYGGNGTTNFALPNLQSQVPMHMGNGFTIGNVGGEAMHTLTIPEMPRHDHIMVAGGGAASAAIPSSTVALALAETVATSAQPVSIYGTPGSTPPVFAPSAIGLTGNSQPHENRQPYLVLNFCLSTNGVFPSRN
jgi:microcystin-dependent protein